LAEQACAGDPDSFSFFDTLDAAYAQAGRFSDAATAAQKAISLAESFRQTSAVARFRVRLELY
jgi:hypothetical protein